MQLLSDSKGQTSSIRVITLAVTFIPLLTWAFLSYRAGELLPFPQDLMILISVAISGKTVQKWIEENEGKVDFARKFIRATLKEKKNE